MKKQTDMKENGNEISPVFTDDTATTKCKLNNRL